MTHRTRLYLSFFLIYFIWGSTYLAIRYAVASIPPFLMAGTRFMGAGLLMYAFLRWRGVPAPAWSQYWRLAVVGIFLFLGGNGLVVWAEQYIDSGLAALLVSTLPLWLILLDWLWAKGPMPQLRAMLGVLLGIAGTVLLIKPALVLPWFFSADVSTAAAGNGQQTLAALVTVGASLLWAIGSIYSKLFVKPQSVFMSAACQMTGGGLALLLVAFISGEWSQFSVAALTTSSLAGFAFLVCLGSMVAISAYVWLLQNAQASAVSTYAFVNPLVALLLGWLIASEQMTSSIVIGAGVILAGVLMVVTTPARRA